MARRFDEGRARKISNAHYQRKKTELLRKKLTGATLSDEDILSLLDVVSILDSVLFHEADGKPVQSLFKEKHLPYRNASDLFNDINKTVSRTLSGTKELPKLQLLGEAVSLVLEKYKLIPETFSHREVLEAIQSGISKNIARLLEEGKRAGEAEKKRQERERTAEKKFQEKGVAFSKLLFPFSEELLDGGAYCVGVECGPVDGKDSERVRDFFMQNAKAFGIGENDWVAWGPGTYPRYSFSGSALEVRYQDTPKYGYEANNLLVRFGRKWAGDDLNVFANLMWLLGSVSGCFIHFYLNKNSRFKTIPAHKLFDFFERFDALLPGKVRKVSVDLRMASNMNWGKAKEFFIDTSLFDSGDSGVTLEPLHEFGMFALKSSTVHGPTIFSAMLHGYANGDYLNFAEANPAICKDLWERGSKDILTLLQEYRLNVGGVNMGFNLAGSKYGSVRKCIDHIFSAFAGQDACAAEKVTKRKAGTIEYGSAVTISFSLEKD